MSDVSWMSDAPCSGKLDMFFDETHARVVRAARKICDLCAVKDKCLSHALENQEVGIWAGTTTNQRARILRKRRKDAKNGDTYTRAV